MKRRTFLLGGALGVAGSAGLGKAAGLFDGAVPAAAQDAVLTAADLRLAPGTPYPLVALPGKAPMGQVYDRPPNYETPAGRLIGTENYPYTDNEYYYVRYREARPLDLDPDEYRLTIGGESAENEITLTLADLDRRAQHTVGAVGMCSGEGRGLHHPMIPGMPWTKGDLSCARWTGVRLKDLLHEVGINESAAYASFAAGRVISLAKPQYWRSYPLESVLGDDVIVATRMNGEQIPFWNGFPARLVVPGTWAPPWVKQLVEIRLSAEPHPMEWSGRSITPNLLAPFSLTVTPTDGTVVPTSSTVEVTGIAFDHGAGIERVEISVDDGATWVEAGLEDEIDAYTWRVWRVHVDTPARPGALVVLTRATNRDGDSQPMDPSPDAMENGGRKETAVRTFAAHLEVK